MPEFAPVVIILGPTASGKTELLTELFIGSNALCPAEVISADSAQVYCGMDIGTAKPGHELRSLLPHHLIDICEPSEQFNAGDFVRLANSAVELINGNGKLAVISGGTGFYIKNFIYGLPKTPGSSEKIRYELKKELAEHGPSVLIEELIRYDSKSAERIHKNDTYRLLRAVEVLRLTGKPLSSYENFINNHSEPRRNTLVIIINRNREILYKRINERCMLMLKAGLRSEVESLFKKGYSPEVPAMRAIGYKEFFMKDDDGKYKMHDDIYNKIIMENIMKNSRNYAKRQLTYFKSISDSHWFLLDDNKLEYTTQLSEIRKLIKNFLLARL
ncbi:MAG: tRNA (adenosine(37)-N6)-dimethylallyltransferase MiaA [Spirochaetaceae bacterium]|jgi:tRNA dimethylallyltransferase|nr:tRNA (adenosine(37)-N6)-dimethylallyltransferase MiaA [Spirochaetaceae bacterium]